MAELLVPNVAQIYVKNFARLHYTCSSAMSQLAEIEATAARFQHSTDPLVFILELIE